MAAAPPSPLQQQLAEVEEAARREGHPVVFQAAWMGRHDVLALLLHVRDSSDAATPTALPNLPSQGDRSAAFLAAARCGHEQCLRVLLEASPSPSSTAELLQAHVGGVTALMLAACWGFVPCVRLLLQHSPDAQATHTYRTLGGYNALMCATINGHAECVALLLQHSPEAQVAAVTASGDTAAVCAAEHGHLSCLQLVLQHSPQRQRLDRALVSAARQWGSQLQRQQRGGAAAAKRLKPYQHCIELLLSKGAMLTKEAPTEAFALVRPVIQDLAARALVSDMATEAAVQAVQEARHRAPLRTYIAVAAVSATDKQPAATATGLGPDHDEESEQNRRRVGAALRPEQMDGSERPHITEPGAPELHS